MDENEMIISCACVCSLCAIVVAACCILHHYTDVFASEEDTSTNSNNDSSNNSNNDSSNNSGDTLNPITCSGDPIVCKDLCGNVVPNPEEEEDADSYISPDISESSECVNDNCFEDNGLQSYHGYD